MRQTSVMRRDRPTHDYRAHVRAIQMSNKRVFAYCEGRRLDPYLYSELIRRAHAGSVSTYDVFRIEDVTGTAGKREIIKTFHHFRRRKILAAEFKGKNFICLFFMDKDVDELRRKIVKSPHAFYTNVYDLEGQIYQNCNLHYAVAIGLSINPEEVCAEYRRPKEWAEAKALSWEHWVSLCVYSALYNIKCGCGFSRASQINPSMLGETDLVAYGNFKQQLEIKSGVANEVFSKRFSAVQKIVRQYKERGDLFKLFKGKWLQNIVAAELEIAFRGKNVDLGDVGQRFSSVAVSTFDFSSDWATQHVTRIAALIELAL